MGSLYVYSQCGSVFENVKVTENWQGRGKDGRAKGKRKEAKVMGEREEEAECFQ